MTHGEKSALGFMGLITLVIWIENRVEKHEYKAWGKRQVEKREAYLYPKPKKK